MWLGEALPTYHVSMIFPGLHLEESLEALLTLSVQRKQGLMLALEDIGVDWQSVKWNFMQKVMAAFGKQKIQLRKNLYGYFLLIFCLFLLLGLQHWTLNLFTLSEDIGKCCFQV